jgi:hypothetical protein
MPLACSTAPRLARPLHTVRIRPASKLAGPNFDSMQGVLNSYKKIINNDLITSQTAGQNVPPQDIPGRCRPGDGLLSPGRTAVITNKKVYGCHTVDKNPVPPVSP